MPLWRLKFLLLIPYCLTSLSLDQKVSLKLIESLWKEGSYAQAEDEINRFLTKYKDEPSDDCLHKLKADLLIKKKCFEQALDLLEKVKDNSDFVKERRLLCLYELKKWPEFLELFDKDASLKTLAFAKKIWDLGLTEAIKTEQNLERKKELLDKASHLFEENQDDIFDQNRVLSMALLYEDQKDYQKAYTLYEKLYLQTKDDAYELCQARMAAHFQTSKALDLLEGLRWKSGELGTQAALFLMQILDKAEDFHKLYTVSLEELKLAPEGYRKAKIALYHLKSLFYLKCFDRVEEFYTAYLPHKILKSQDLAFAVTLLSKTFVMKNEFDKLENFYQRLKKECSQDAQIVCARILTKSYLEKNHIQKAEGFLKELLDLDILHKDEYLLSLGACYNQSQCYEMAEKYFLDVLQSSADVNCKSKALNFLTSLPQLSATSFSYLIDNQTQLDIKTSPKTLYWLVEALKNEGRKEAALGYLTNFGDQNSFYYHRTLGEIKEAMAPQESLIHYEKALELTNEENLKAYIHNKLFTAYFDYDKDKATEHLFNSINLFPQATCDKSFKGLAFYLYSKAHSGIKIFLNDAKSKEAASNLIRMMSYKVSHSPEETLLLAKTLTKLCRYEEALEHLKKSTGFYEILEKAKILNHQGCYAECDALLEQLLEKHPFSLHLEGQYAMLTKICLNYQRLKSGTYATKTLEELHKDLKMLKVCLSESEAALCFEVELLEKLLFAKDTTSDWQSLQNHPYLDHPTSSCHRKILNFIVNKKLEKESALTIDESLSDTMTWILQHLFGDPTCL